MLAAAVIGLTVVLVAAIVVQLVVARRSTRSPDHPAPQVLTDHALLSDRQAVETASESAAADRAEVAAARTEIEVHREDLQRQRDAVEAERGRLDSARQQLVDERVAITEAQNAVHGERQQLAEERRTLLAEQERLAGLTAEQARAEVVAAVVAEATLDAQKQARRVEADARAEAETRARSIVAHAVQRLATETTSESTVVSVRLPDEEFKGRVIGREGRNIKAFEAITGADVLIDQPETVQISCFDPLRREVARLTMDDLVTDGRIHPQRIEDAYRQNEAKIDAVCRRAAQDALLQVGIADLHDVLVDHLGLLRFRQSYGQNVLAHLVETAAVAGTLAAELGLPPQQVALVKRCAFLHDIGKALTHDHEGSHALLGAELARKYGESEAVAHAIEAHHNEVPPTTIEAVLTQASDSCSGGRPGARRESAQAYSDRLARIEEIAKQQPGVERVFAMQAGHEVRVIVEPDQVDDVAAAQIARAVARQIEQELTYPGQVRVTVIRESRVSEVAH